MTSEEDDLQKRQTVPADWFSEKSALERRLGLTEAFSILIGRIIGSGIFRTPAPIMILVGCVSMFYGVWILGGVATLLGAFVYAEMAAMMPKSGGPYAFLRAAYPPVWAFLRGWAMFFVSETGAIAAVSIVFAEYGNSLFRLLTGAPFSRGIEVLIALAIIWLLTLVNCFGVALGGKVQNVLSLLKLLALGAVIGVCFASGGNSAHFSQPFWPEKFTWGSILAMGAAMRYAFFAFSGWEGATYVAEEVKNPRKNLPISLILGIAGVMLIYLAANSAYIYQLPVARITESKWVAVDAMEAAIGGVGGILVSLAVMLNTFGSVSSQVLVKARGVYAMARDGLFFGWLGEVHPRYKTPNRALIAQGIWATVLLFAAGFAAHAYETIIDFFSFTSSIFNISTFAAVYILRKKYPDAPRYYKAWGYPVTLILVLIIQVWFMITTLITAFVPSLVGIGLTCTGLLYYYRNALRRK
jgi:basic amino acid/polyamine antiporter, APA family